MTFWYVLDAEQRTILKGTGDLPTLPSGVPSLRLRAFDAPLTAEQEVTELNRWILNRAEVNLAEAVDEDQTEMQLAKLHGLWLEYRLTDRGKSWIAFANNVLRCDRNAASRVIARDPSLDPIDVDTYFQAALEWQSANPFVTSPLQ